MQSCRDEEKEMKSGKYYRGGDSEGTGQKEGNSGGLGDAEG